MKINEILVEKQFKDLPSWANKLSDPTHGGGKFGAPQGNFVPPAPYELAVGLPGASAAAAGIGKGAQALARISSRVANRGTKVHKDLSPHTARVLRREAEQLKIERAANKAYRRKFPNEVKIDQGINKAQRRLNRALLQTGNNSAETAKAAEKLRHQYGVAQQTRHLARNADRTLPKNLRRSDAVEKARHNKEMNLNKEFRHEAQTWNDYLSARNADYVARQATRG